MFLGSSLGLTAAVGILAHQTTRQVLGTSWGRGDDDGDSRFCSCRGSPVPRVLGVGAARPARVCERARLQPVLAAPRGPKSDTWTAVALAVPARSAAAFTIDGHWRSIRSTRQRAFERTSESVRTLFVASAAVPQKYRDVRKALTEAGWSVIRQRGSHEIWGHADHVERVVVAGKDGDTVPVGTLGSIRRATGMEHLR